MEAYVINSPVFSGEVCVIGSKYGYNKNMNIRVIGRATEVVSFQKTILEIRCCLVMYFSYG